MQNHPPQKPSFPPPHSPKPSHLPPLPPPPTNQTPRKPSPPPITRTRRGVADLPFFAGTSWTLSDAGGASAPGTRSHNARGPLQKAPRGPFHQGPFPLLSGRSAKPTVRHLSFSLSKSPKGTLRQRRKLNSQRDTKKKQIFFSLDKQKLKKKK
jgi:hypothetical protein